MIKNIIRYLGLALVIIGVVLVMKNLFSSNNENWNEKKLKNNKIYYQANIKLLDDETEEYIVGSNLVLKNSEDEIIEEWTTENKKHTVIKLEKGTYTVEQIEVADGYEKDNKVVTFDITDVNKDIVMYNTAINEEVKETSSEISVDNTLSMKNSLSIVGAILIVLIGIKMVLFPELKNNN